MLMIQLVTLANASFELLDIFTEGAEEAISKPEDLFALLQRLTIRLFRGTQRRIQWKCYPSQSMSLCFFASALCDV